ncbi:MAG TPA: DMT family transporter, partial [Candidatus Dormibacteraeota bacterium]|nr:DMT family transporter [Candidatus Dormibacteraeota bacterium]
MSISYTERLSALYHLRFFSPMTRRALLLFLAMSVIWGISYLFIRIAVSDLSPFVLVFARTGIGMLILLPIAVSRGELRGLAKSWLPLFAFAAVEIGIPWVLMSHAEQSISSSLTGLLVAAVPLVGVVLATALGNREHLGLASGSGFLLGVIGVAAIVGFDVKALNLMALVEMAGVVVCYAVGPAILARYLSGLPSVGVIAASLTACTIVYAPLAALQWPHSVPPLPVLASVVVLAVVCTAIGFLLFFALVAEIGPVRATVITYVNPAVAAVLGVIVLHERFTAGMAVGFVLVVLGSL